MVHILLECILVTACKRSLGQGNIFTHLSFCSQGGCAWLLGGMCGCQGHAWLLGVCACSGGHAWLPGGHAWFWGACVVAGGVHGCQGACMVLGGCAWLPGGVHGCQGACMVAGGASVGYNEIWSMSGRYASYWNAFLLKNFFITYFQTLKGILKKTKQPTAVGRGMRVHSATTYTAKLRAQGRGKGANTALTGQHPGSAGAARPSSSSSLRDSIEVARDQLSARNHVPKVCFEKP